MNDSDRVFIIAEAGINHNGDLDLAKEMISIAKNCGVDCVKFQTFRADQFVSDPNQTYTYQSQGKEVTESMLEMFRRYQFERDDWLEIIKHCQKTGIVFSSTAQNPSDLDFLFSIADLPFVKVGSDDLTNLALMKHYALKGKPMIISAGMAYAYEIEDAVRTIRETGNNDITVLHCVSSYPTEPTEVNLKKIPIIRDAFGVNAGFSDHTVGSAAAIGAVCFGARFIEKHFTLDTGLPGPDHWFSTDPIELKRYANDIRTIEQAIGNPELRPTDKELGMRRIARRKIVADADLNRGETLTIDKVTFKRCESEDAVDPKNVEFLLGRRLIKDVVANDSITLSLLE